MIFNFVYIVEAGRSVIGEYGKCIVTRLGYGYFAAMLPSVTYVP